MKAILFYVASFFLHLLSRLPLSALYVLSDGVYFLVYHVIGYRRKLVRKQMLHAFPDKTEAERKTIEKEFYQSFCDIFIETIKLLNISDEEMSKRMVFKNVELVNEIVADGQNVFMMLGHYCNWEWVSSFAPLVDSKAYVAQIYHPLHNPHWDQFFLKLRSRFGAHNVPMKRTLREIITQKRAGRPIVIGFIADQAPKNNDLDCWTNFLNQDTPIITGAERIARQTNAAMLYLDLKRVKRGYYEGEIKLMTRTPEQYENLQLSKDYANCMEKSIVANPAAWLWTHNRWKRKKPQQTTNEQ